MFATPIYTTWKLLIVGEGYAKELSAHFYSKTTAEEECASLNTKMRQAAIRDRCFVIYGGQR